MESARGVNAARRVCSPRWGGPMNNGGLIALLIAILLLGGGALAWYRAEGTPASYEAPESLILGRDGQTLDLALRDGESGLRSLRVWVSPAEAAEGDAEGEGEEIVLLEEHFPGNLLSGGVRREHEASIPLEASALGELEQGVLHVEVRDWSWRGGFGGNLTARAIPLRVDVDPPQISVRSGLTYIRQGGAASVAYHVSEETERDGVAVGEHFYPGFPKPGARAGERIALFAAPVGGDPDARIRVMAEDAARNRSEASWPVVLKPHPQPTGRVNLPDSFLENVVPRLMPGADGDRAAAFHRVNTEVRAANEAKIRELAEGSAGQRFFGPVLRQLANSKVTSRFGEKRSYEVNGRAVSEAVHYGYDLASYAAAPVTAASAGRVIYADDLGIYGNCVILDHGLGLTSLYGHLSRVDVEEGQQVEAGARLGLTGATGLAGGDHLHFAVMVGDTYVDPLEWWDRKWVETHVDANLGPAAP